MLKNFLKGKLLEELIVHTHVELKELIDLKKGRSTFYKPKIKILIIKKDFIHTILINSLYF